MEGTAPMQDGIKDDTGIQTEVQSKILVVDDNSFIRHATMTILIKEKFTVVEATDGHEAIDKAITECPDLILMDLSMPNLDGFAAIEELKTNTATKGIPIIVVTAYATKEQIIRATQLGVAGFLVKPFNIDTLIETVKKRLISR